MANIAMKDIQFPGLNNVYTIPEVDNTLTQSGEAADAKKTGDEISALKQDLTQMSEYLTALPYYLYKKNIYINQSGVETALTGYNIYKIPVHGQAIVHLSWTEKFWNTLSASHVLKLQKTDDTFVNLGDLTQLVLNEAQKEAILLCNDTIKYAVVCSYNDSDNNVTVEVNQPFPDLKGVEEYRGHHFLDKTNAIYTKYYLGSNGSLAVYSGSTYSYVIKVRAGDRIKITNPPSGISNCGSIKNEDGTVSTFYYSFPNHTFGTNGIAFIAINESTVVEFLPCNDVFTNTKAVAFGTSLTYRAQTTGGYLQYLPSMGGISFDNQGEGSSTILTYDTLPDMLAKIKGYTEYADKDIVTIEGFANDWYYNGANLGTWTDSNETTVCGCLRSAINYVLTQNAYTTIYLILDHYGSGISASTATNASGDTQFEFYEELAKVAESLGVNVIKLYAESGINEKTTQYLIDNIHPSAAGALQTALTIWNGMKNKSVKVQNKTS